MSVIGRIRYGLQLGKQYKSKGKPCILITKLPFTTFHYIFINILYTYLCI